MTNFLLVQIFQTQDNASAGGTDTFLGHGEAPPSSGSFNQITYGASVTKFHNYPHFIRIHFLFGWFDKAFKVSDNVGTIAFGQDVNFAHDFIGSTTLGIAIAYTILMRYYFDSDDSTRGFVYSTEYLTEGPFAKEFV